MRCEGTVTDVYTHRFRSGYGKGACFKIDCKTEHSQSGGPIFDEHGAVCGIIMAGAFAVDDGTTLGASIWLILSNSFVVLEECTEEEWFPSRITMHELIQLGIDLTDGSERMLEAYPTLAGTEEHFPAEMELHHLQDTNQNIPDRLSPENLDMTSVHREFIDTED